MQIAIIVEVDEDNPYCDTEHPMGITNDAYEKLTGYPSPLSWLGDIQDVRKWVEV